MDERCSGRVPYPQLWTSGANLWTTALSAPPTKGKPPRIHRTQLAGQRVGYRQRVRRTNPAISRAKPATNPQFGPKMGQLTSWSTR